MIGLRVAATLAAMLLASTAVAQKNTSGGGQGGTTVSTDGMVVGTDPQTVLSAIQSRGHTASLGVDNMSDPMVSAEYNGTSYNVYFYGCENHTDCDWLLFHAGFDLPNGWTLQGANDWNNGQLVGEATLDSEQDPFLSYFVTIWGGLNQANFADVVDQWGYALDSYKTTIGF